MRSMCDWLFVPALAADALLSRLPFVSYHYQLLLMYGTVYLVFMWIYYGEA